MKNKLYLIILIFLCSLNGIKAQQRWQEKSLGLQKLFPVSISAVDAKTAWVVTWAGNFAVSPWIFTDTAHHFSRTVDSGRTWTSGTFPYLAKGYTINISAVSADTAFIAHYTYGRGGIIYRTTDGGATWTNVFSSIYQNQGVYFWDKLNGITLLNPDVSSSFGIYKTSDAGANWARISLLKIPSPLANEQGFPVFNVTGNTVQFLTSKGRILRSINRGDSWTALTVPSPSQEHNSIDCDGRGNCLMSGGNYSDSLNFTGRFYSSTDSGATWTASALTPYCATTVQYIPGTSIALASVRKNNRFPQNSFRVMLTTNHGQTWQVIDTTSRIYALGMVNNKSGFATEYQNDTSKTMVYRYIGSPLSGLWSGDILRGQFTAYPNPVSSAELNLNLEGFDSGDYTLLINNINGELIHRQNISFDSRQQIIIPTNLWQSGVYVLTLTSAKGSVTRKVVKTN